jgi:hypothetical protein
VLFGNLRWASGSTLIAAGQFLDGLAALPAERFSRTALIGRVWELHYNFTAYDATYIALAEATGAVLYTCDEKLPEGPQSRGRAVHLVTRCGAFCRALHELGVPSGQPAAG